MERPRGGVRGREGALMVDATGGRTESRTKHFVCGCPYVLVPGTQRWARGSRCNRGTWLPTTMAHRPSHAA